MKRTMPKLLVLASIVFMLSSKKPIQNNNEFESILRNFTLNFQSYSQREFSQPFIATGDWYKEYSRTSAVQTITGRK